jgi:radical SAM protein (TIGR04043 family)
MNFKELRVKIQSLGVKVPLKFSGRKGGAGPSEGQLIIINGQYISVPTTSWFVDESPYTIVEKGKLFYLSDGSHELCEVLFPKRPSCYDLETGKGVNLEKIALIHGRDCFASTVYQGCSYFDQGCECAFCGIGLSLKDNRTEKEKNPEDLGYAALKAKELDQACHVTLTTGKRINSHDGTKHLADCVKSIKDLSSLPVHVQVCPVDDETVYEILKNAGADTIGIHVESCSEKILKKIAPAKAELGIDFYIQAWQKAVSVFGRNQVSSFLIAGIGDDLKGIVKSAELMAELGVYPYVLPLRPVPGTLLENYKPPSHVEMIEIYEKVAEVIKRNNLSSKNSKAGCVRCGVCSAITEFE